MLGSYEGQNLAKRRGSDGFEKRVRLRPEMAVFGIFGLEVTLVDGGSLQLYTCHQIRGEKTF